MFSLLREKACSRRRPVPAQGAAVGSGQTHPTTAPAAASNGRSKGLLAEVDPLLGAKSAEEVAQAAALRERGNEHFRKKELEDALDAYSDAIRLQCKDPSLWLNRSIVNRQLKNWEDAELDAECASELDPKNAKAHYSRALALQQLGELRRSLASCKAGLAADPDSKALAQLKAVVTRSLATSEQQQAKEGPAVQRQGAKLQEVVGTANDDPDACPMSKLKENDLQDIKNQASAASYMWRGDNPSDDERNGFKEMMINMFKSKYMELKASAAKRESQETILNTSQYEKEQKLGLQLKGGHQPLKRPADITLPRAFREPLGVISIEDLTKFGPDNEEGRHLLSVYGDIFDVSDRPDKYGPEGVYRDLSGKDITWGLFTGIDQPDYCNRVYDLFKAKDLGKDKIAGVCSWLAWYETEYGAPVGRLEPFTHERDLPAPPLDEVDETCAVM